MYIEIELLNERIIQQKKRLIQIAMTTGLNSNETIRYSQKLDKLITNYQKVSYQKKGNGNQFLS